MAHLPFSNFKLGLHSLRRGPVTNSIKSGFLSINRQKFGTFESQVVIAQWLKWRYYRQLVPLVTKSINAGTEPFLVKKLMRVKSLSMVDHYSKADHQFLFLFLRFLLKTLKKEVSLAHLPFFNFKLGLHSIVSIESFKICFLIFNNF